MALSCIQFHGINHASQSYLFSQDFKTFFVLKKKRLRNTWQNNTIVGQHEALMLEWEGFFLYTSQLLTNCLRILWEWIAILRLPIQLDNFSFLSFSFSMFICCLFWISPYSHGQKLINLLHIILLFSFNVKSSALPIILQNLTTWKSSANLLADLYFIL